MATEIWFLGHILRISSIKRVSNEEVLRKAQTSLKLIKSIHERLLVFWGGHIMRTKSENYQTITSRVGGTKSKMASTAALYHWSRSFVHSCCANNNYWSRRAAEPPCYHAHGGAVCTKRDCVYANGILPMQGNNGVCGQATSKRLTNEILNFLQRSVLYFRLLATL